MADQKLTFTRASNAPIENLNSFILEAYFEDKQIADVCYANKRWRVKMMAEDKLIEIPWVDFLTLIDKFSKFVAEENEILLNKKESNGEED